MNKELIYPGREALLQMQASVNGWIVLRDYAYHFGDSEIFRKIITDYLSDCPLFELDQLLKIARIFLNEDEFQLLIAFLFKQCHLICTHRRYT